ncbi:hypothetical protein TI39_contig50g00008 [Zymoseptoria brevis]|uniref:Short-chain dehydrogenase like protein n=1 Tax=Zymoseptoria brevis TaxID=1047168 RepID=A0A0F4GYY8_9PEZI|nr:hypothetical protein TI39_contig50g00008 [Zymoseptoria brevis]
MTSVLVTGAGRGSGLAFVKELVSLPIISKIIASVRSPSADLESIARASSGRVTNVTFYVADEESIKEAVPAVEAALEKGNGLDILINNVGIDKWAADGTKSMASEDLKESFREVANIGTTLGSLTLAEQYTWAYALDHGKEGFNFIALTPGEADLTPEQGAKASLDIIWKPNDQTNGKLTVVKVPGFENRPLNSYDGKDAPW